MAILYPWATKEYLLWEMSLGQIVLYHNLGFDLKNNVIKKKGPKKLSERSEKELLEIRAELRRKYGEIGNG